MDKQYVAILFRGLDVVQTDLAIGLMSDAGYYGFEESTEGLRSFILQEDFDEEGLMDITRMLDIAWEKRIIREENWNARWESSFSPVVIPGKVAVRASFHSPVQGVGLDIIITPKMSFGTGHHATTWLMMEIMFGLDMHGKELLDVGTGTGILAILAEKLGAKAVDAIDHDSWCIENARENIALNCCRKIHVALLDHLPAEKKYDLVLANIHKTFLLENRAGLVEILRPGGLLLMSGLLPEDREDVEKAYLPLMGQPLIFQERNNWIGLAFSVNRV
jgi:ribosomal protein L11 methyltransferase